MGKELREEAALSPERSANGSSSICGEISEKEQLYLRIDPRKEAALSSERYAQRRGSTLEKMNFDRGTFDRGTFDRGSFDR